MTDQQLNNPNQWPWSPNFEEDISSPIDILIVLARQIKIILITPTIFCTFTIIYVLFFAKPVYTSNSKIMILNASGMSQTAALAAQFGVIFPDSKEGPNWAISEIINSRTLARVILEQKYDTEEFGPQKTLLQILNNGNIEPESNIKILIIETVEKLQAMIAVSENVKTGAYTLYLHASEPELAAEINKNLIKELNRTQMEYNKAQTSETRQFIEERIVNTEKELIASEEELKIFMDRNRRIENSPSLQLGQQRLAREVTVLIGVFTTLKQQLETTKIEEVKESNYVVVLDPPNVPIQKTKPAKKRMVIIFGFLGICLGLVFAFIREYFQNRDSEEQEKIVQAQSLLIKNFIQMYHTLLRFWKSIIPFKQN